MLVWIGTVFKVLLIHIMWNASTILKEVPYLQRREPDKKNELKYLSEKDFKPAKSSFHNYFSLRQPKCPMKIIFPKMSFFSVINNYFCCFLFATCFYFRAYSFEISLILITPKLNPRSLSKILFFKINLPDSNLNQKIDHTPN